MMNYADLILLRARLIAAQANRHTIGAAEAYVRALEAEVTLTDYNSRRATAKHLLALVDAALEGRKKLPTQINRQRDFSHNYRTAEAPKVEAPPPPPVEEPEPAEEKKAPKGRRVTHGRARKTATPAE